MAFLRHRSFRVEAAVIGVASISVIALALLLVQDAVTQTAGTLRSAAEQELGVAAQELKAQYEERAAFSESQLLRFLLKRRICRFEVSLKQFCGLTKMYKAAFTSRSPIPLSERAG